jgi:hypothetical protein
MSGLLDAAKVGDIMKVQGLVAEGASVKERDGGYRTALLLAVDGNHVDLVKWLLQKGGSTIAERDKRGCSAVLVAAKKGFVDLVAWLLRDGGSNFAETDKRGRGVVLCAAQFGHLKLLQWLEEKGASLMVKDTYGRSAAMCATQCDSLPTLKWLFSKGAASASDRDDNGETILFASMFFAQTFRVTTWLLEEGVSSISQCTLWGKSVWDTAVQYDLHKCGEFFVKLLKVMVMLEDAPSEFLKESMLSYRQRQVCRLGPRFRKELPLYLAKQKVSIIDHCPLPVVLGSIVATYAAITPDDMWSDGLPPSTLKRSRSSVDE